MVEGLLPGPTPSCYLPLVPLMPLVAATQVPAQLVEEAEGPRQMAPPLGAKKQALGPLLEEAEEPKQAL